MNLYYTPNASTHVQVRVFQMSLQIAAENSAITSVDEIDLNNASIRAGFGQYEGTGVDVVRAFNLEHDGRNILLDKADAYNTGDSLVLSLPDQTVRGHHPFTDGARAYLIGGSHVGSISEVQGLTVKRSSMENEVSFPEFGTVKRNVFVIGDFELPGVNE